jgi:hypothetical protein
VELGGDFTNKINPKHVDALKAKKVKTADLARSPSTNLVMKPTTRCPRVLGLRTLHRPIKDQKGTEKYAAGAKATLAELNTINCVRDNVVGKVE